LGLNIPVIISQGSAYSRPSDANKPPAQTTIILAHLDTGASITVIDVNLAKHLKLLPGGISQVKTAGGIKEVSNFTIDLLFANSTLSSFVNLPIASADLGFDISGDLGNPKNIGMLIGRDVMSYWHITWDGQTSTVIIND
jgi:hypothetical protein